MARVNLTKKIEGGRYAPVVVAENGRIKPDWVVVDGSQERHPEGRYYLDWTEGGKRRRRSVGISASSAIAQKLRKETELEAQAQGIRLVDEGATKKRRVEDASSVYLDETKTTKKHRTFLAYTTSLTYFMESCKKTHLEDIERSDLIRFIGYLRDEKEQAPRSVSNKFENVMAFLKAQGTIGLIRKGDRPTFVLSEPEVYEKEELADFFKACTPQEKLLFNFFLMTGMRDQEVVYSMQRNVHQTHSTVSMKWNPEYKWSPKANKEREIPVPPSLIEGIVEARAKEFKGRDLVFPTASGGPKFDYLDHCKAIAERAGYDPSEWWLHKFRATFATWHLQNGVDLRTVQKWMGHVDLESTMRYLKPARNEQVRDKVNSTFSFS